MHHVKQRCVIFVNEHDNLLASLLIYGIDKVGKSYVRVYRIRNNSIRFLVKFQNIKQISVKLFLVHVLATAHVEVEHGVVRPFLFMFFYGKSFKQFFLTLEVAFECRYKQ